MNICHDTGQPCPRASCDCCHDERLGDLERRLRACVTKIETISGSTNAAGKTETNHPPATVPAQGEHRA